MKVLVAMDEYNGIISSYQANRYVEEAVASQIEEADVVQVPLFNGRHELMDSIFLWQSGAKYRVQTHDVDMNETEAVYGITDHNTAVIEGGLFMKGDSAIELRSSYGLGEVILDALSHGAQRFVISLGGIDSFDGGAGMLQALGVKFYDDEAQQVDVSQGSKMLKYIRKVDLNELAPQLKGIDFQVVTDFASHLYGKQSEIMQLYPSLGLTRAKAAEIDNLIWYFSEIMKSEVRLVLSPINRGGAGGGVAALLHGLFNAEIMTSHALVDQITHLEDLIEQADLIIFGEGVNEKDQLLETTTGRIAELATKYDKPAIAICATADKFDQFETLGVTAMFNTFVEIPESFTDFKMGIQIRHYAVQALKLLKAQLNDQ